MLEVGEDNIKRIEMTDSDLLAKRAEDGGKSICYGCNRIKHLSTWSCQYLAELLAILFIDNSICSKREKCWFMIVQN